MSHNKVVRLAGIEPAHMAPEANALSVALQAQYKLSGGAIPISASLALRIEWFSHTVTITLNY